MRIIVLGGAGDMGSRAVEELARAEGVDKVTIADRNVEAARQLEGRLHGGRAEVDVSVLDASDHSGLVRALEGYDVAASALGPFYLFEPKLVQAAIEAGVDYTSICDDWVAADEVMVRFTDPAREKGVTVITGLGTSPGISNVGVRYFAEQMDRLDRVDICVYMPLNSGGGEAVIAHTFFIMSGRVATWRERRRVMVRACSEERVVEFPRFGAVKVWNMGHGEPVTVPLFIEGIEEVNFLMGFGAGSGWFVVPAKLGLFTGKSWQRLLTRLLNSLKHVGKPQEPEWGAVRIDAWGQKGGRELHRMACGIGQMREATGLSLAVGTLMLGRKEMLTTGGGVYGPEACFDPVRFLTLMRERGITAYSDLDMIEAVV